MIVKAVDTHSNLHEFEVESHEEFLRGLSRGRWFENLLGWKVSPVHIVRVAPENVDKSKYR